MIIIYGNYALAFTISDNGPHDAAFLTSSQNMNDGRIGLVCSMKWSSGTQTTGSYVEIGFTITQIFDAIAMIGGLMISNVVGLPKGLRCVAGGIDQVLTQNALGELQAAWLPQAASNTGFFRIYNDDGVSGHPVAANAVFGIGEVLVGRAISLPTLIAPSSGGPPSAALNDPTAFTRMDSGSLYQCMRKPWDTYQATLGMFTTAQAFGGSKSNIPSGGNPPGVIDINRLRGILSTSAVCGVCDFPSSGFGAGTVQANGMRYDQAFMQPNWIVARPSEPGSITMDQAPYCSWNPTFAKTA